MKEDESAGRTRACWSLEINVVAMRDACWDGFIYMYLVDLLWPNLFGGIESRK